MCGKGIIVWGLRVGLALGLGVLSFSQENKMTHSIKKFSNCAYFVVPSNYFERSG